MHISWLIAWLSGGVVVGVIGVASTSGQFWHSPLWLMSGIMLVGIGVWSRRNAAIVIMVIAGILIGLWRGSVNQQALQPYARLSGTTVTLQGKVTEDTDIGKGDELVVRVRDVEVMHRHLPGEVWVSLAGKADIKRSDTVTLQGKLSKGFGSFAASMYRAKLVKLERQVPGDVARQVRDTFADKVRTVISEPQASLGIGYLVGQRRALPDELDTALRVAGLMHVVVASGYNLTILVRLVRRLLARISKYLAASVSGVLIVAFVAVTGASASMSRAGLVTGLSLLAWYYGRRFHPLVLLPLIAAMTLLADPSYGQNNLGWQLSFAAFAGVMILAPLIQAYFFGDAPPSLIRQVLGETIAAQLCTLPILILAFGQFSNVAVVANLLIVPLVPLAMLLTFVSGLAAAIVPHSLASLIAMPAEWLLRYMTATAEYLASTPWAQTTVSITWWGAFGFYAVIIATCFYMWLKAHYSLLRGSIVE